MELRPQSLHPRRAAAGLFFALVLAPACSSRPCGSIASDPNAPAPAIECPSGHLCYQGECLSSCSAGQERAEVCAGDGECGEARPRCVDGFCSACDESEQCIPTLNICRRVSDVDFPPLPEEPGPGARPPVPLDGGWIDGGLRPDRDAGVPETPPEVEVTHAGHVDIAVLDDYLLDRRRSSLLTVRMFDVSGNGPGRTWRADWEPPAIEEVVLESEQCEIRRLVPGATAPRRDDLGVVRIEDHPIAPGSIAERVVATFEGELLGYRTDPPAGGFPAQLVTFSTLAPDDPNFLSVSSAGRPGRTEGGWPNPAPQLGHHVPFELIPFEATRMRLERGLTVAPIPAEDLVFRWNKIDTGVVATERVVVRMIGDVHELQCVQGEGRFERDDITIDAATLAEFGRREGPGLYPLILERASAQRLSVPPAEGRIVSIAVRVRHSLVSDIQFQ